MSVSFFRSATNAIVFRALASIAPLGAIRPAGAPPVHGRGAVIGLQTSRQAAAALMSFKKRRPLPDTAGMPSSADGVKRPRRSAVEPKMGDRQILMASGHVPSSRFELFVFTSVQPPLSLIEPRR